MVEEKVFGFIRAGFLTDFVGTPCDTENKISNHAGKGYAIFAFHETLGMFASNHVVGVR